jgi:hypothetical protein
MTKVEYGNMHTLGTSWQEAIMINPDWQARLIRRTMVDGKSKVHFIRRVHEMVRGFGEGLDLRSISSPVIRHFGWMKSKERLEEVAKLCDTLWKMDQENADTYVLEKLAGTAHEPWNVLDEEKVKNYRDEQKVELEKAEETRDN